MKINLRGVVRGSHKIGEKHLVQVEISVQSENEDLQLEPTMPPTTLWVTATPEQAEKLPTDAVIEGDIHTLPKVKP